MAHRQVGQDGVGDVSGDFCPACGGQVKILAFLTDPPVVSGILLHLELPHLPSPLSAARGPPQGDFLLDQTSAFDPAKHILLTHPSIEPP